LEDGRGKMENGGLRMVKIEECGVRWREVKVDGGFIREA
jgi:hypothetical protein